MTTNNSHTDNQYLQNSPRIADLVREYAKLYNRSLKAASPQDRQQILLQLKACDALLRALHLQHQDVARKRLTALEQQVAQLLEKQQP